MVGLTLLVFAKGLYPMTIGTGMARVTLRTLWLKNIRFHVRAHLVVFLGCMITCATLTGALLVGTSLQLSLSRLNKDRLGFIQHAIVSTHFFDADLADRLAEHDLLQSSGIRIVPILQLSGTVLVRNSEGRLLHYAGQVQVLGVPDGFWSFFGDAAPDLKAALAVNDVLARRLDLGPGQLIEVQLQRPSAIPAATLAGRVTDESGTAWQSSITIESRPVAFVTGPNQGGRFSLYPQAQSLLTVYLPLADLQRRLREPLNQDNPANVVLLGGRDTKRLLLIPELTQVLRKAIRLKDFGLRLRIAGNPLRYLSLESNRLLLDDRFVEVATKVADRLGWPTKPTLTYLVNLAWCPETWFLPLCLSLGSLCNNHNVIQLYLAWRHCYHYVPYMTVTVLDPSEDEPWGPFFSLDGERWTRPLQPGQILLTEPAASDLLLSGWSSISSRTRPLSDTIYVRYFVESEGWLLKEREAALRVAGVLAWKGASVDPILTPEFPGLRGTSPADWKPPFPRPQWHPEWIRFADDYHWQKYRAAPRAFISAETARQLGWFSRYGTWTSVRIAPTERSKPAPELITRLEQRLLEELTPERFGFTTLALQAEAAASVRRGPAGMFSYIFLAFSGFLMVSALLLVTLLVRLHLQERSAEFGLFAAFGYSPGLLRLMLILELAPAILLGCLAGLPLSAGYALTMLRWIRWRWPTETLPEAFHTEFIAWSHHGYETLTHAILPGLVLSALAALIAAMLALRELNRWSPRVLLTGQFAGEVVGLRSLARKSLAYLISGAGLIIAAGCVVAGFFRPKHESPLWFFSGGGLLVVAGLASLNRWLGHLGPDLTQKPRWFWLGLRFVSRQPRRNLLTAALLAVAVFLISAVQVFYKTLPNDPYLVLSGTGGFPLLAESDIALPFIPQNETDWQALLPDWSSQELRKFLQDLASWRVRIYGFRVRPGEDISCLNLYQPHHPRILAVPDSIIRRGGFEIGDLFRPNSVEKVQPWMALYREETFIPALVDAQTGEWVLHVRIGETLEYSVGTTRPVQFRIVGQLRDSIFQGALLIAEKHFDRLFPGQYGYSFFLIEVDRNVPLQVVRARLESALGERFGFSVRPTLEVLAEFQGIENLYLVTFQLLGGVGLMLGACGLGVVLLRNVWERRGELALLQALGYSRQVLAGLLLVENGAMTLLGVAIGLGSALVSLMPHLSEQANISASVVRLTIMMLSVLITGFLAGALAIRRAVRLPVLVILRRE